jgi:hypothetical protein
MKWTRRLAGLIAVAGLLWQGSAPARARQVQPPSQGAVKVQQLLDQAGYTYRKASSNIWIISATGKTLKSFNILVATTPDGEIVLAGVVLVAKARMTPSVQLWSKLLHANNDFDRVKVGLDNDEDVFVRVELSTRNLDVTDLKTNIDQVSNASDEIYESILPMLAENVPLRLSPRTLPASR